MKIIITERQLKKIILELHVSNKIKKELGIDTDEDNDTDEDSDPEKFLPYLRFIDYNNNGKILKMNFTYYDTKSHDLRKKLRSRTKLKSKKEFNEVIRSGFKDMWNDYKGIMSGNYMFIHPEKELKVVFKIDPLERSKRDENKVEILINTIFNVRKPNDRNFKEYFWDDPDIIQ